MHLEIIKDAAARPTALPPSERVAMVSPEDDDEGHYQSSYGRRQTAAYTNRDAEEAQDRLQARLELSSTQLGANVDSLQFADDDSLFADTVASDALQPPYSYPSYTMGPMEITLVNNK